MRYVQLRAFHHVAVEGGFSRAAAALNLTQPAISDQVRKLEEDYDILLFNRTKKQVTLTEAGQKLLEISHRMFEVERQARDLLAENRAVAMGTLRIISASPLQLTELLTPFADRHRGIRIVLRSGNSEAVINALVGYEADIGVLGEIPAGRRFMVRPLGHTRLVAFAGVNTEAGQGGPLSLAQLATCALVLREPGSKTREALENAARRAGVPIEAAFEVEGREAIREIVASGAGVGVVSEAEFGHDPRLVKIDITGGPIRLDEALVCLKERAGGRLIGAFMELATRRAGPK
ncbi:MAG: LysR family transcriptional regulator [Alphaproteobacteria bacterium]|nr:LysR family transcriptional regulator [Alphaproteobacteria bacterium]